MTRFLIKYLLPVIAVGLIAFTVYHVVSTKPVAEKTVPTGTPPKTEFAATVAGSGIIESQTENIEVGTPVPGVVMEVEVGVGQNVKEGDLLFKIDDRELQAELRVREQSQAVAEAELARLERLPRNEQIPVAKAMVDEAKANIDRAADDLRRGEELLKSRTLTDQDVYQRRQAYAVSLAQYQGAKAQLAKQEADLTTWDYEKAAARAQIQQAIAQIQQVRTQIERTNVKALVEGRVLQVNVRPGEYAGTPASRTLILLGNVDKLHVRADIDENDIPRIPKFNEAGIDNPTTFARLKGDATHKIELKFVRYEPYVVPKKSLTGLNTERVDTRVLQLIFEVLPGKEKLYVGQQVDIFIDAAQQSPTVNPPPAVAGTTNAAQSK